VVFDRYYKYSFYFCNKKEGILIAAGGDNNDFYEFDIATDTEYLIEDVDPYCGESEIFCFDEGLLNDNHNIKP